MTTRHPGPPGAAMIAAKAVMDSSLERGCDVASLAVLSRYPALPCRPMSRDIFVRDVDVSDRRYWTSIGI